MYTKESDVRPRLFSFSPPKYVLNKYHERRARADEPQVPPVRGADGDRGETGPRDRGGGIQARRRAQGTCVCVLTWLSTGIKLSLRRWRIVVGADN